MINLITTELSQAVAMLQCSYLPWQQRLQTGKHSGKIEVAVETILMLNQVPVDVFLEVESIIRPDYGGLQITEEVR